MKMFVGLLIVFALCLLLVHCNKPKQEPFDRGFNCGYACSHFHSDESPIVKSEDITTPTLNRAESEDITTPTLNRIEYETKEITNE